MRGRIASLCALGAALALLGPAPAAAQERGQQQIEIRPGNPNRGWLGVSLEGFELVTVRAVVPGSPAARAGIAAGDTVLRVNGDAAVRDAMRRLSPVPGDTVRIRLRRGGRERDVPLVAERRDQDALVLRRGDEVRVITADSLRDRVAIRMDTVGAHLDSLFVRLDSMRVGSEARRLFRTIPMRLDSMMERARHETIPFSIELGSRALGGAEFTQMNAGLGRYFQTDKGLLALRVAPGTPAARAGLESGDVVVKVDGAEVETLRDLRQAVARARGSTARLEVIRQGRRRELTLRWERGDEVRVYGTPLMPREIRTRRPSTD